MTDFYATYAAWFSHFYNRPFTITREEWAEWCRRPSSARPVSDTQFDHDKEVEGDAQ